MMSVRLAELQLHASTVAMVRPFPTVDVPDHAHYTIGSVILVIGITGMIGNFLVIYAFCRSRSLRTPANMFIINLAVTDLLMCVTQTPIFFTTSMYKRWIFGEKGCELYAFCGALFGICSMITLTVIAIDRYFVITRPLTSIGVLSRKRAFVILMTVWIYSLGWSLPPFFGWSAYVPEGLLTSCTWDYMTFSPSVRAYTMLLFIFVFFLPLFIIIYCYFFIFRAIRATNKAVGKVNGSVHSHSRRRESVKNFQRLQNEWKMAKIALMVILLYVISWSPYSCVALTAFAGLALAKYIPCLGFLLCISPHELQSTSSSFMSLRRSTVTSQTSDISGQFRPQSKPRRSSASDSESCLTDTEADLSSMGSRPASRQVSCDISRDTTELPEYKPASSFNSKVKSPDSGIFEKTSFDFDASMAASRERSSIPNSGEFPEGHVMRRTLARIPSIIITSESSHFLPNGRKASSTTCIANGSDIKVGPR
ncbi:melanopsin-A isoform X2 [Takifugu rubripes]|uniref:melanopsin-A isoform X2 n=1 Tax=Takifugu rubripes TaxID=31033 RepID=UPI001145AB07|nr:melanopsin-A isoform X2 [Takifugu rubripes]